MDSLEPSVAGSAKNVSAPYNMILEEDFNEQRDLNDRMMTPPRALPPSVKAPWTTQAMPLTQPDPAL